MVRVKHGALPHNAGRRRRRSAIAVGIALSGLAWMSGCADFSREPAAETIQPSLSAAGMVPKDNELPAISTPPPPTGTEPSNPTGTGTPDPCHPAQTSIIAACLDAPWGLAVLPDGKSALVGERTTGRILRVAPLQDPVLVAQISGLDAGGDGGLLGLALSPHYVEDGLLYAYVTTPADNRILRIAPGDTPKPIFTGIPRGAIHNGGRMAFGADGYLYIATGDAGAAAAAGSLAGKVLRLDEFGRPAPAGAGSTGSTPTGSTPNGSTPTGSTPFPTQSVVPSVAATTADMPADPAAAIYASGLTNPTGMCTLIDGRVAVMDRAGAADVLIPVAAGADLPTVTPLWTYAAIDGGAVDCTESATGLAATSLEAKLVTSVTLSPDGSFTGKPEKLAENIYGRLLTIETGTGDLLWVTTANKDGHGDPQARDDMVVVITGGGGGGDDGKD